MIRGIEKKTIHLLYDSSDDHEGDWDEYDMIDYLRPDEYYDYRDDNVLFNMSCYLDLLVSPYYVVNKLQKPGSDYINKIIKHFFILYPSAEDYKKYLAEGYKDFIKKVDSIERDSPSKDVILQNISEIKEKLYAIITKVDSFHKDRRNIDYALKSYSFASQMKEKLDDVYNKVEVTPSRIIEFNYYSKRPNISWRENPLAFFTALLFGDELEAIIKERKEDEYNYEEVNPLFIYIERRLEKEAKRSVIVITHKLKDLIQKKRKKEYLEGLVEVINKLYERSSSHAITKEYMDHQKPYKMIISGLKQQLTEHAIPKPFNCYIEPKLTYVETDEFLNNLQQLKLTDREGYVLKLFSPEVDIKSLRLFVKGQFGKLPRLQVNWGINQFYYLLFLLIENGASLNPSKLTKLDKISFRGTNSSFNERRYSKYPKQFKQGNQLPKDYEKIRELFLVR